MAAVEVLDLVRQSLRVPLSEEDGGFEAAVAASWRAGGRPLVTGYWDELQGLTAPIDGAIAKGRCGDAAAMLQVAAHHAVLWHPGLFASPTMERQLWTLGQKALRVPGKESKPTRGGRALAVCHVMTEASEIGGHSRNLWRWIANDSENIHSVALTRQHRRIPPELVAAATSAGGSVVQINRSMGGLLSWCRRLQPILAAADIVVLHAHNWDVVPFLALAGMERRPPIALSNHCDHLLWLGTTFADIVLSSRLSGANLAVERRGVPEERSKLLPLCLELPARDRSRAEAKRALSLPDDSIVLLTVARALKYVDVAGTTYADAFVPLLRENPRLRLVALGPGGVVDWSAAERAAPGQVLVFPEQPNTRPFYEAADIYVDSYPFVSVTSLTEAGLFELPAITRNPFGSASPILTVQSLGLGENLLSASSVAEMHGLVRGLAANPNQRGEIGARMREGIAATNMGAGWKHALREAYGAAMEADPRRPMVEGNDGPPESEDIDLFLPFIFGGAHMELPLQARYARSYEVALKAGPLPWRSATIARMAARGGLPANAPAWRYMLPEWVGSNLKSFRASWAGK